MLHGGQICHDKPRWGPFALGKSRDGRGGYSRVYAAPGTLSTPATPDSCAYPSLGRDHCVIRRRFLHGAAALATVSLLASACSSTDVHSIADNPGMLLTEGGFTTPDLDMQIVDSPLQDADRWDPIITFSGPAPTIENWVKENFPGGLDSRAESDDLQVVVAQLGEGVQRRGDRVARGAHEPIDFVVVVSQEEEPTVHVAMWSPAR